MDLSEDQTKINFKIRKNKDNIFFSGDKSLKFKNKILSLDEEKIRWSKLMAIEFKSKI